MPNAVVPLSIVTSPDVPWVDTVIFPLMALVVVLRVILSFEPVEVKLEVPLTVNAAD